MELVGHAHEIGRAGKPDTLDACISHRIGGHLLEIDPLARFDVRFLGGYDHRRDRLFVRVGGEISESLLRRPGLREEIADIVTGHYARITGEDVRSQSNAGILRNLGSGVGTAALTAFPDLAGKLPVPRNMKILYQPKPQADALAANGKAGDQGTPIGVAYRDAPNLLPWERHLATGIRDLIDQIYQDGGAIPPSLSQNGTESLPGLRPDGKIGVDARYDGADLKDIELITIACEHDTTILPVDDLRDALTPIINTYLEMEQERYGRSFGHPKIVINGNGDWAYGGWRADEGNREAKPPLRRVRHAWLPRGLPVGRGPLETLRDRNISGKTYRP